MDDVGLCLKWKAATALDRLSRMKGPLPVTDYLLLVRTPKAQDAQDEGETKQEAAVELGKWESGRDQNEKLNDFIWEKLVSLFTTRTIQISIPPPSFEGRGSLDKYLKKHGIFMMASMMGSMLTKMAMAKIGFIAGKALLIAKISLIVSLVIGFRRLLANQQLNAEVYNSLEQDAGWQRKFELDNRRSDYGANMAYAYHKLRYNH
ncbi:hypothetical protein RUM43_013213 [Polyplax serrata]